MWRGGGGEGWREKGTAPLQRAGPGINEFALARADPRIGLRFDIGASSRTLASEAFVAIKVALRSNARSPIHGFRESYNNR